MTRLTSEFSLLSLSELDQGRFDAILRDARRMRTQRPHVASVGPDAVAFLSDRRSLRTRVATAMAAADLGLRFVDIPTDTFYADPAVRADYAEFAADELRSLIDLGVRCLVARISDHAALEAWRDTGTLPIINGCSAREHPLQGLSDALVIHERFGRLDGVRLAFVGSGASPVLASLLQLTRLSGLVVTVITPMGFAPSQQAHPAPTPSATWTSDLMSGLADADVLYADEIVYRPLTDDERDAYRPYRLTRDLVASACPTATIMHCLPHSDEVEEAVLELPRSLVREQVRWRIPVTAAVLHDVMRPLQPDWNPESFDWV